MTEIIKGSLWLCGIGELRMEIARAKPDAIISLTEPDDFRSWESNCSELVDTYVHYSFPDAALPDMAELERLAKLGADLVGKEKRVIVHCAAGHNRSALLMALIVRKLHNITGRAAVEMLQAKRASVLWNKNFSEYLYGLDKPLIGETREQAAAD